MAVSILGLAKKVIIIEQGEVNVHQCAPSMVILFELFRAFACRLECLFGASIKVGKSNRF